MRTLCIEYWSIDRLVPYENNPRKNDHAVGKMADALRNMGFVTPVLVTSSGELIDGHLRLKAACANGIESIPVIVIDDLSSEQVRALRMLINRSATWAEWDEDALLHEMQLLVNADFDLSSTGFEQGELDALLMQLEFQENKDPDDIPSVPITPLIQDGEIWLLGQHRLLCGDATSAADMRRLMRGEQADMIWTDPPYNVDYIGKAGKIKNDKMTQEKFNTFLLSAHTIMTEVLRIGGGIYVAHSEVGDGMSFRQAFVKAGLKLSACLIWRKQSAVLGRGDYHHQHEPILYGWKPGAAHKWYGNRKQKTVMDSGLQHFVPTEDGAWQLLVDGKLYRLEGDVTLQELNSSVIDVPRPTKSELHPTTKPIALIERMIANSSPARGLVLDPFGGSGSTLIACEIMGRRCHTMELDPKFAEVIVRRWEEFTGLTAQRERDAATLEDIATA